MKKSREELLRPQPWHVRAQWWAITFVCLAWMLPLAIFAMLNPLWFRRGFEQWVVRHAEWLGTVRERVLKSQLDKYNLFNVLKDVK